MAGKFDFLLQISGFPLTHPRTIPNLTSPLFIYRQNDCLSTPPALFHPPRAAETDSEPQNLAMFNIVNTPPKK